VNFPLCIVKSLYAALERGIHTGCHGPSTSSWLLLDLQAKVDVWHRLVHGARAQDINLYSHNMIIYPGHCSTRAGGPLTGDVTLAQVTFGNSPARFEQELLSLPRPELWQAPCDRAELAALDVVKHDDVGAGRNRFVGLIFVSPFNV
jgi:hypothetical protein